MRKKRELQEGLPKRSDPNYMKLYNELHRERLAKLEKDRVAKLVAENPNYWKEAYKPAQAKEYRKLNRKILSEKDWVKRGIKNFTYEKYHRELIKQCGKCKICSRELKNPNVDHDHTTGEYRAILCNSCNQGLGIYEKNKLAFELYLQECDNGRKTNQCG